MCDVPIDSAHFGITSESDGQEASAAMSFQVVPVVTGSEDD
jgi:hypothetical protein